jgi:hypothetical protein
MKLSAQEPCVAARGPIPRAPELSHRAPRTTHHAQDRITFSLFVICPEFCFIRQGMTNKAELETQFRLPLWRAFIRAMR